MRLAHIPGSPVGRHAWQPAIRAASSMEVLGRRPRRNDPFMPIKKPRTKGFVPPTFAELCILEMAQGSALGKGIISLLFHPV